MSTLERFQNYIAGKFVDADGGRTFDSLDPYAGEPWAAIPEGTVEDVDHAVAAARAALDGDWGRDDRLPARRADAQARRPDHRQRRTARPGRGPRQRQALPGDDRPAAGAGRLVPLLRRARRQDRGPGHPDRQAQLLRLHAPRAGRRGRGDHAVELPAAADDVQARPGPGGGLHVRGQALGALPGLHAGVRPGAARGRVPRRRVQRRGGLQPRPRRGAGRPPGRRQGRVHRLDRHRARGREGGGGERQPGHPGAGRQVAAGRLRGRRPARPPPTGSSPASSPPPARPAWPARG